jgi:hypothetical protein
VALFFMLRGPGPISLDALLTRHRHHDEPRSRYTGPTTQVPVFRG